MLNDIGVRTVARQNCQQGLFCLKLVRKWERKGYEHQLESPASPGKLKALLEISIIHNTLQNECQDLPHETKVLLNWQ